MAQPDFVSPDLIDAFNHAAGLARSGSYEASLAAWNHLLEGSHPGRVLTGEFLGVAHMRRAWVYMDLGRYHDARLCFEHEVMRACLGQFDLETLYEYFFSYGNTLGELGDIAAMDDALSRALGIAAEELGDLQRCQTVWNNLMTYALNAPAWEYLERECQTAIRFADNTGSTALGLRARWNRALSLEALGRIDQARWEAGLLLERARQVGAHDAVPQIEEMLTRLVSH